MQQSTDAPRKFIGVFTLAMIAVSAIVSLRNLPTTALLGTSSIGFYVLAAVTFFIPLALCCAELASTWSRAGGMYIWVTEAFNFKFGLLVVWLEWIGSVVWLPVVLSFLASTASYLIDPSLEQSKVFMVTSMLLTLWVTTFINFLGIKTSSLVSTIGITIGTILPAVVLICLGLSQIPTAVATQQLDFSINAMLPGTSFGMLAIFTGMLLGFAGLEIPAYYVQHVKSPKSTFPKALFLAVFIILAVYILGSLAIASVIPTQDISLVGGTMQSFKIFFSKFNIPGATKVLALLMLVGGGASLNTWLIGPSRGLLACARLGNLPKFLKKTNHKDVPVALLLMQAVMGSGFILLFAIESNSMKAVYWVLSVLASQTYVIMYGMLFAAVIKLRKTQPSTQRPYRIPGGKLGLWLIAGLGLLTCAVALVVGMFKPDEININISEFNYMLLLSVAVIVFCLPPFILKSKKG